MNIVVDTNIIFSALLNPQGKIGDLLLNSSNIFDFFAPDFILEELNNHHEKLKKISKLSDGEIVYLKNMLFKKIDLIDLNNIRDENWKTATELVDGVDEFDAPFIALSLELHCSLWTGDKKLYNGLQKKDYYRILDTDSMWIIRDGK